MSNASFATGSMWAGFIVFMGEAAEEIVALAQELGSQGIAIGSHGPTAKQSLFLGSVQVRAPRQGAGTGRALSPPEAFAT